MTHTTFGGGLQHIVLCSQTRPDTERTPVVGIWLLISAFPIDEYIQLLSLFPASLHLAMEGFFFPPPPVFLYTSTLLSEPKLILIQLMGCARKS